jgi:NAD(P)-dependent dehydrogenase (short-subunit alcohol dehydrogenase family)
MGGSLDGKVCLVTGGGSGIGAATAIAMADAGASAVVIAGRRDVPGEDVAEACRTRGSQGLFVRADVSVEEDVAALVGQVTGRFGRLDVAFDNAGRQEARQPLASQSAETFDEVFDVNARAVFLCLRYQLPVMAGQGEGSVVVNASVSGIRNPNAGLALYSASKAAAISLVRSAAMEYGPQGIRVNAVAPGRVATDMMLGSGVGTPESVGATLPVRRMGRPDEVASAVVWLASDQASYVTGAVIPADGGFLSSLASRSPRLPVRGAGAVEEDGQQRGAGDLHARPGGRRARRGGHSLQSPFD